MEVWVLVVAKVTVGVVSQLSVAVGEAGAGTALHWAVVLAGQPLKTGAVVSTTATIWVQVLLLPQLSVAVQMRVIV